MVPEHNAKFKYFNIAYSEPSFVITLEYFLVELSDRLNKDLLPHSRLQLDSRMATVDSSWCIPCFSTVP